MRITVRKWGNSAAVRIPSSVMAAADLRIDQAVEVTEEDGRIILRPIRAPGPTLEDLLDRMLPETFHEEVDFGEPRGNEAW